MSFRGLSESDRIRRKRDAALYSNFVNILNTQPNCITADCVNYGDCIVRYPTYEYRQNVKDGAIACNCSCTQSLPEEITNILTFTIIINESFSYESLGTPIFVVKTLDITPNFVVDWGDETESTIYTSNITDGVSPGYYPPLAHTYANPGIYNITMSIPEDAQLLSINVNGGSTTNQITGLVISPVAKKTISEIDITNNSLSSIDLSNCEILGAITLTNNNLNSNSINTILNDILNTGPVSGVAQLDGQSPSAPPTTGPPDGIAAKAALISNGWTVVTDLVLPGITEAGTYLSGINGDASSASVAVDSSNNVYIYGNYVATGTTTVKDVNGTSQSDSSITLPSTSGNTYLYIIKYDSSGTAQWAIYMTSTVSTAKTIHITSSSDIYISGGYTATSPLIYNANGSASTIALPSTGAFTGFLIKFSTTGICQWATYIPSTNVSQSLNITSDSSDNVYLVGSYQDTSGLAVPLKNVSGTGQIDSSITISTTGGTNYNAYIIQYSSAGIVLWANTITGSSNVGISLEACTINNGQLYCGGNVFGVTTGSTVTLNNPTATSQTPSTYTLPPVAAGIGSYAITVKYNLSGVVQWSTYFSNTDPNSSTTSIVGDSAGNIYVLGIYKSNPGPTLFKADGTSQTFTAYSLGSSTIYCIYLISYDQTGSVRFGLNLVSDLNSGALAIDSNDKIYLSGSYVFGLTVNIQNASGFGQINSGYTLPDTILGNAVLIAYDTSGQVLWATYLPGESRGYGCVVTSTSDVYLTGKYRNGSAVTIYEASGTSQAASSYSIGASATYNSAFLIKYATS
jgi:hypothetical protein